jgi:phosphoglycerate dehydrogenase-like enzyme
VIPEILVITPVHHITGVVEILENIGNVTYIDNPTPQEVIEILPGKHAIYTNPNKSDVFIGAQIMDAANDLRVICTASTGTNHIDKEYAAQKKIPVLSLTEERQMINKITSTAEHAFALMMSALRHIPRSFDSVKSGEWDYTKFIGRQLDHLTVGVVGYGRLGTFFANYAKAFGSRVVVYDPYKKVEDESISQVELDQLLTESDIISLHVHVTPETTEMIDRSWFMKMKPTVLIVNTARGEIIKEKDLIQYLTDRPTATFASDVIAGEVSSKQTSPLIEFSKNSPNVILTPHIGGMTVEGQQIAYGHAAQRLKKFFSQR